ncbi:MAG: hypothetical protein AB7U45_03690, partial [Desulfamplus sp.]
LTEEIFPDEKISPKFLGYKQKPPTVVKSLQHYINEEFSLLNGADRSLGGGSYLKEKYKDKKRADFSREYGLSFLRLGEEELTQAHRIGKVLSGNEEEISALKLIPGEREYIETSAKERRTAKNYLEEYEKIKDTASVSELMKHYETIRKAPIGLTATIDAFGPNKEKIEQSFGLENMKFYEPIGYYKDWLGGMIQKKPWLPKPPSLEKKERAGDLARKVGTYTFQMETLKSEFEKANVSLTFTPFEKHKGFSKFSEDVNKVIGRKQFEYGASSPKSKWSILTKDDFENPNVQLVKRFKDEGTPLSELPVETLRDTTAAIAFAEMFPDVKGSDLDTNQKRALSSSLQGQAKQDKRPREFWFKGGVGGHPIRASTVGLSQKDLSFSAIVSNKDKYKGFLVNQFIASKFDTSETNIMLEERRPFSIRQSSPQRRGPSASRRSPSVARDPSAERRVTFEEMPYRGRSVSPGRAPSPVRQDPIETPSENLSQTENTPEQRRRRLELRGMSPGPSLNSGMRGSISSTGAQLDISAPQQPTLSVQRTLVGGRAETRPRLSFGRRDPSVSIQPRPEPEQAYRSIQRNPSPFSHRSQSPARTPSPERRRQLMEQSVLSNKDKLGISRSEFFVAPSSTEIIRPSDVPGFEFRPSSAPPNMPMRPDIGAQDPAYYSAFREWNAGTRQDKPLPSGGTTQLDTRLPLPQIPKRGFDQRNYLEALRYRYELYSGRRGGL